MMAHPACELFPLLEEQELAELTEDIRQRGLMHPVVLHEGQVLDGRNRLIACRRAGVEPVFIAWSGSGSPTSFVISANLYRRDLDASQRAMLGARAKALFEAETRQCQGTRTDLRANLSESAGRARDLVAELVGVSPRRVKSASQVLRAGTPELVDAVASGKTEASTAAEVANLPPDEQREVVAWGAETETLDA